MKKIVLLSLIFLVFNIRSSEMSEKEKRELYNKHIRKFNIKIINELKLKVQIKLKTQLFNLIDFRPNLISKLSISHSKNFISIINLIDTVMEILKFNINLIINDDFKRALFNLEEIYKKYPDLDFCFEDAIEDLKIIINLITFKNQLANIIY